MSADESAGLNIGDFVYTVREGKKQILQVVAVYRRGLVLRWPDGDTDLILHSEMRDFNLLPPVP